VEGVSFKEKRRRRRGKAFVRGKEGRRRRLDRVPINEGGEVEQGRPPGK